jgi:hypothetical protein
LRAASLGARSAAPQDGSEIATLSKREERAAGTRPADQGQDVLIQLQSPQVPLVGPEAVPVEQTPVVLQ